MKLALFSNQFASKDGHGISRYSKELYAAIKFGKRQTDHVQVISAWSDLPQFKLREKILSGQLKLLWTGRKGTALLWTYLNWPKLEMISGQKWDLVHCLSLGYPVGISGKWIVTIHDLGCLTHPDLFPQNPQWLMKKTLKQAVTKSNGIICVSKYTASEVIQYAQKEFCIDVTDKIKVIYEGVGDEFFCPPSQNEVDATIIDRLPEKFIFCAAKLSPRKNIELVLKALPFLDSSFKLVLAGGEAWENSSIEHLIHQLQLKDRIVDLGYLSKPELMYCYSKSFAFVYPSFFEGFGLTILEAMACGAPVITSNCTSIPEVAADAAILIDPTSTVELINSIKLLDSNLEFRNNLIELGKLRAKEMSWSKTASETLEFYQEIMNNQ